MQGAFFAPQSFYTKTDCFTSKKTKNIDRFYAGFRLAISEAV
jgi:hypothetical protein